MVEAVLAGVILIGFLASLKASYFNVLPGQEYGLKAHLILRDLDEKGVLRGYAEDYNYTGLSDMISSGHVGHSVRICDALWNCAGPLPNGTDVWAGTYVTAGDASFSPRMIKLYLWRQS